MTDQSTEVATTEDRPRGNPVALVAGATPRAIVPVDFEGAWRIATAVMRAGMAPKSLDSAEKCMVAILHGLEVGLTPMNALQSIAVINGRPTIWGDGAVGLIRASGLLEYMEEKFVGEGDDLKAVCTVKRKGEPRPVTGEFSMADAKKAQLLGKTGPWQTYPRRMLQMRARWPLRDVFADVLKGLALKEEIEDIERSAAPTTEGGQAERQQPARRAVPPPPADEPAAEETAQEAKPKTETVVDAEIFDPDAALQPAIDALTAMAKEHGVDFPGDAKLPADDAGPIPEKPRRRRPPKEVVEEPAKEASPEDEWVEGLELAFSSCDDMAGLDDAYTRFLEPKLDDFSPVAVERATAVYNKHADRVEQ